jgi:hypothetical protein
MTGNFTNWDGDVSLLGPLYPFVGWEWLLVIVLVVLWVWWHITQINMENRQLEMEAEALKQSGALQKAMMDEHTLERM